MMKNFNNIFKLIAIILISGCSSPNKESEALRRFEEYFKATANDGEDLWDYTTDTVKLWFDDKEGDPMVTIKGAGSTDAWQEWDEIMHSTAYYDSIWYNYDMHAIQGYFYENNDFYTLIGKKPTKTIRTCWLNDKGKIHEILMYWIPEENTSSSEHLVPIVEWAMEIDSTEIMELYPEGRIVPSRENAIRWKQLLVRYNESTK